MRKVPDYNADGHAVERAANIGNPTKGIEVPAKDWGPNANVKTSKAKGWNSTYGGKRSGKMPMKGKMKSAMPC